MTRPFEAIPIYGEAAAQGHARAQYSLSGLLQETAGMRRGGPQTTPSSYDWLARSAQQGNALAQTQQAAYLLEGVAFRSTENRCACQVSWQSPRCKGKGAGENHEAPLIHGCPPEPCNGDAGGAARGFRSWCRVQPGCAVVKGWNPASSADVYNPKPSHAGTKYTCTLDTTIFGTADVKLASGKTDDTGYSQARCEQECAANSACKSFVYVESQAYCELWSKATGTSTAQEPGVKHCVKETGGHASGHVVHSFGAMQPQSSDHNHSDWACASISINFGCGGGWVWLCGGGWVCCCLGGWAHPNIWRVFFDSGSESRMLDLGGDKKTLG